MITYKTTALLAALGLLVVAAMIVIPEEQTVMTAICGGVFGFFFSETVRRKTGFYDKR